MASILFITKPLEGPWNDSGKNVPRDLVRHLEGHDLHIMTAGGKPPRSAPHIIEEKIYQGAGSFSPKKSSHVKVMKRLLKRDDIDLLHFFFAPNPATSAAMRLALLLRPRKGSLQTVLSVPKSLDDAHSSPQDNHSNPNSTPPPKEHWLARQRRNARTRLLFATDHVVTLSEFATRRLRAVGVPGVVHIPPGVPIPKAPASKEEQLHARAVLGVPAEVPLIVFPGDYQFSNAAKVLAKAIPKVLKECPEAHFIYACRIKQPKSLEIEAEVRDALTPYLSQVQLLREVPNMPQLLAAADLITLPQVGSYAKADLPLVLLEAMSLGRGVLVADSAPIVEVIQHGGGLSCEKDDPQSLADTLLSLLNKPGALEALGAEARDVACKHFSAEKMARRYEDLYASMLKT